MRRIYDSQAVSRDDDDSFKPREEKRETEPQSFRSLNASAWSDRLIPHKVRRWSVSVDIWTPAEEFTTDEDIPFTVTMRNRLPIPMTVQTSEPLPWNWSVDDHVEANRVGVRDPPDIDSSLSFDRGETREFNKRWSGMFQVSEREWERAEPGEYTLSAAINVDDAAAAGLAAETTIRIVE